ncbi:hypothetical protein AAFC00_001038 [Neodothiora populina]|uniref:Developmental regulator n=1 Tax=Neodothiora populina TaxID=2781224 RepID=A0ABR3PMQ5_9PEZI
MPTYVLHGFRWPRPLIRIHIILQNLDDAAAEWICSPTTTQALLSNFRELFPESMPYLPGLRLIEQYDPNDLSAASLSQPYAYVADVVEEVKLGVDLDDVRGRGVSNDQWGALMEIRDRLAPDEKVGWFVVVCGDEERWAPPTNELIRGGHPVDNSAYNGNGHIIDSYRVRPSEKSRARGNNDGTVFEMPGGHGSKGPGDETLRELRERSGYRTASDTSDSSSGAATRHTSATTTTPTIGPGGKTPEFRSPESSDSFNSLPRRSGGVRGWLAKRKSQKSIREIAKAQSREQAPPLPKSSPAPGKTSQLAVR